MQAVVVAVAERMYIGQGQEGLGTVRGGADYGGIPGRAGRQGSLVWSGLVWYGMVIMLWYDVARKGRCWLAIGGMDVERGGYALRAQRIQRFTHSITPLLCAALRCAALANGVRWLREAVQFYHYPVTRPLY
jgi:hypothetical protein